MPRSCRGLQEGELCCFGKDGNPAQPKPGNPRCSWCDQDLLRQVCDSIGGRRRLQQVYQKFAPEVAELARSRLPPKVRWSFPVPQPGQEVRQEQQPPAPEQPNAPAEPADHPVAGSNPPADGASDESPSDRDNDQEARPEPNAAPEMAAEAAPAPADAAPAAPPLQVNLARADSINEAEAILVAHANAMAPDLRSQWIAGDGNCLYRSVALQTPFGEEGHFTLRQQSTQEAQIQLIRYIAFFDEQTPEEVTEWAFQMQRPGHWGDHISVRALADLLGRPLIVWRLEDPNQPPSCFVPHNHDALHATEPIYLRLDEGIPGAEHYTALLPRAAAAAEPPDHRHAEERPPKRARMEEPPQEEECDKPRKQTPAEKRGLTGIEALGDWGKVGLTREEYHKLLGYIKVLTPRDTLDSLHEQFPHINEEMIKMKFLQKLSENRERLEKAETDFSNQKKALALMGAGTFNQDVLQAQCPGVGIRFLAAALLQFQGPTAATWKGEFDRRFGLANL